VTQLAVQENGALALIRDALKSDVSPEKLSALLAVKKDWEADEARKAFNIAVSEFQQRCPIIEKADDAYGKKYARIDRIWREIRPLLTQLGLSVTWQTCELRDKLCRVEGQLRHRDGHGERLVQDVPLPDQLKGQNEAQRMGSASTYAKRYALCAALGIVTGEDDDGHAAGTQTLSDDQSREVLDLINAARGVDGFNEPAFWKWVGVDEKRVTAIPANRFGDVVASLKRKIGGSR
jgi:hypothetical protein